MKKIAFIGILTEKVDNVAGPANSAKAKYIELCKKYGKNEILKISVYNWKENLLPVVLKIVYSFFICENIIMNISYTAYKPLMKLLNPLNKILKRKIHYFPVGNPNSVIVNNVSEIKYLELSNAVYFQTESLKRLFEKMGLSNGYTVYNFRHLNVITEGELRYSKEKITRFCTFSRVSEIKGIQDVIDAICTINKIGYPCEVDIYGPIEREYIEKFDESLSKSKDYVKYCGKVVPENSVNILKKYDALLFPSRFDGEGLPGTILDAYSAGLPVISSAWEGSEEIIQNGKTGVIYNFCDLDDFIQKLIYVLENKEILGGMKKNCIKEVVKYSPENAMQPLYKNIV